MTTSEQAPDSQALLQERSELANLVAAKRVGRQAMIDRGMEIGSEEDDPDMKDLLARMTEIDVALGQDPDQPRLEIS